MAEHALEPRHDAFGLAFLDGICARPELEVDAQDTFRLAMHQGGVAGMKRWMEPEAAIIAGVGDSANIGDKKALIKYATRGVESETFSNRTACAIGSNDPASLEDLGTRRRLDREPDTIGKLCKPGHAMAPSDASVAQSGEALDEHRFQHMLGKVDEGRVTVAGFGLQIKAEQFIAAVIDPPDLPCDAAFDQRSTDAETTHDLERPA
jgi:hypothetical protein